MTSLTCYHSLSTLFSWIWLPMKWWKVWRWFPNFFESSSPYQARHIFSCWDISRTNSMGVLWSKCPRVDPFHFSWAGMGQAAFLSTSIDYKSHPAENQPFIYLIDWTFYHVRPLSFPSFCSPLVSQNRPLPVKISPRRQYRPLWEPLI